MGATKPGQLRSSVLRQLCETDRPLTTRTITHKAKVNLPYTTIESVRECLRQLVGEGFIARTDADGSAPVYSITEAGRAELGRNGKVHTTAAAPAPTDARPRLTLVPTQADELDHPTDEQLASDEAEPAEADELGAELVSEPRAIRIGTCTIAVAAFIAADELEGRTELFVNALEIDRETRTPRTKRIVVTDAAERRHVRAWLASLVGVGTLADAAEVGELRSRITELERDLAAAMALAEDEGRQRREVEAQVAGALAGLAKLAS